MRLHLSLDEVKEAVVLYVGKKIGVIVKANDVSIVSHTEGSYEDARDILDGLAVDYPTPK